jgi:tripartite-type tricarboxylate transporter receptor subunit TctC
VGQFSTEANTDGLNAVLGGQVPLMFQPPTNTVPHIRQGTLVALGTTGNKRLPVLPDVPTIAEVLPGFSAEGWQGLMAPAGTPAAVIDRLNREMAAILSLPETTERFAALGIEPMYSTPQKMQQAITDDTRKWKKVILDAHIEVQ